MTISVVRAWLAFAAVGAGMIHLALVVSSPLPLAAAPAVLGTAELGWGVAVLARTVLPAPRIALGTAAVAALASLLVAGTIGSTGASPVGALPLALAAALDGLLVVLLLALRFTGSPGLRRGVSVPPSGWRIARSILAIAAGAIVVGAVTTPALAATEAGRQARPHGAHLIEPAPTIAPDGHAGH